MRGAAGGVAGLPLTMTNHKDGVGTASIISQEMSVSIHTKHVTFLKAISQSVIYLNFVHSVGKAIAQGEAKNISVGLSTAVTAEKMS